MSEEFNDEQKNYLQGFVSGLEAGRAAQSLPGLFARGGGAAAPAEPIGPDAAQLKAQDAQVAAGRKLVAEEQAKRDEHPFDAYARMGEKAAVGEYPKGVDVFRWKYHGLFYVAPAQDSFMCRLRIHNGVISAHAFAGVAAIARRWGGDYTHVTTRNNLQIRDIDAANGLSVLEALTDLGLVCKGSGADNVRNMTGSPVAGLDPSEILDTRPFAAAMHHAILNDRSLYNLPRKFNIAFDGGGCIGVLEETNDIGFQAALPAGGGAPVFRLMLGGITGHKDLARHTGVWLETRDAVPVATAILRVFSEQGDRTDRKKARLKYILDAWGFDKFIAAVEEKLGRTLPRGGDFQPRAEPDRHAHIGAHRQSDGRNWIGVVLPAGRLETAQMEALAGIARAYGSGELRLTVWQNLLIPDVADDAVEAACAAIVAAGMEWRASAIRAGFVACTGKEGCRLSNAHTKSTGLAIVAEVERAAPGLDVPLNLHVTGCPNSCAQHYIGDIGLVGRRVDLGETDADGFDVVVGGGTAGHAAIGHVLFEGVLAEQTPALIARIVNTYLVHRAAPAEGFQAFAQRQGEALRSLVEATP